LIGRIEGQENLLIAGGFCSGRARLRLAIGDCPPQDSTLKMAWGNPVPDTNLSTYCLACENYARLAVPVR